MANFINGTQNFRGKVMSRTQILLTYLAPSSYSVLVYWILNVKRMPEMSTIFQSQRLFCICSPQRPINPKQWSSYFIVIDNARRDSSTILYKSTKQRKYETTPRTDTVTDWSICESLSASIYQDHSKREQDSYRYLKTKSGFQFHALAMKQRFESPVKLRYKCSTKKHVFSCFIFERNEYFL